MSSSGHNPRLKADVENARLKGSLIRRLSRIAFGCLKMMMRRPILIVGVKLIGVMVLYWALQHISGLLYSVGFFLDKPPSEVGYISPGWQLAASCLSFLFAVTWH
jgi:hypothetical protein